MDTTVRFWNGNKTDARRAYEQELLELVLSAAAERAGGNGWKLVVDDTDYPRAEDEGAVLEQGTDLLVTVAGNRKFEGRAKIEVSRPLAKGLLGYRIPLVRADRVNELSTVSSVADLRAFRVGVPATWADAGLFRYNKCQVREQGGLETIFDLVRSGACDYTTLGANEVEAVLEQYAEAAHGIVMHPSVLIFYPFPLVFYVNAGRPDLADRLAQGLETLEADGTLDELFNRHYGRQVKRLSLSTRSRLELDNPATGTIPLDSLPSYEG